MAYEPSLKNVLADNNVHSEILHANDHFLPKREPINITFLHTAPSNQTLSLNKDAETNSKVLYTQSSQKLNPICENSACPCVEDVADIKKKRSTKKVVTPLSKYGIFCVQFTVDEKHVAVGYGNGGVYIVNNDPNNLSISPILHGQKRHYATMAIKFHNDLELMITAGAAGEVNAWNTRSFTSPDPKISLSEDGNEINALDISADGLMFATAGKDRHIRLYDSTNFCLYHIINAPDVFSMDEMSIFSGHSQKIFALRFHPEETHIFVTAGWDNCMKIWDKRMSRCARQSVAGPRIYGSGLDLLGNYILTGSYVAKDSVQLWDYRSGNFIRNVRIPRDKQKGDFVYCTNFLDHHKIVAGGSGMNCVFTVDLNGDELIDVIDYDNKAVMAIDALKDNTMIASGGVGGTLMLSYLQN